MKPTILRRLLEKMYFGSLKRPIRVIMRFLFPTGADKSWNIITGPLRGKQFSGVQAQVLGIYELSIERAIVTYLFKDDVCYDVGANIGYFSLLASHLVGNDGHVFCFEPVPANVETLDRNILSNHLRNCTIIDSAVSDKIGSTLITINDGARASLVSKNTGELIQVSSITLDEFAKTNRLPKLVKIDVEGAESHVLRGALGLLKLANAPVFIIEIHDEANDYSVKQLLEAAHFTINRIEPIRVRTKNFPYHVIATKLPD